MKLPPQPVTALVYTLLLMAGDLPQLGEQRLPAFIVIVDDQRWGDRFDFNKQLVSLKEKMKLPPQPVTALVYTAAAHSANTWPVICPSWVSSVCQLLSS
jgi:ABC-type Fe2+-enterobactin transport system substrate-binding protein